MMKPKIFIYSLIFPLAIFLATTVLINKKSLGQSQSSRQPAGDKIEFFDNRWDKALMEASKQHKPIFLDAYASWCGPCKKLKRTTFRDQAAAQYFNSNFINVSMDMEKGEGRFLAQKFSIRGYPTLIIANEDGNVLTYSEGYVNPGQLISLGKKGLELFHDNSK